MNLPSGKRRPTLFVLGAAVATAAAWWALTPDPKPGRPGTQVPLERDTSFPERREAQPSTPPLAASEAPREAASLLPDGLYVCNVWLGSSLITLGKLELRGGEYRGPANAPSGPFQPLSIDAAGQLASSPNFSQLASTGATIGRSYVSGKPGAEAFTVEYVTGRGSRESMDCTRG